MRDYPRDTEEILKADRINDLSFVKQILSCFAVENDKCCTFICMQIAQQKLAKFSNINPWEHFNFSTNL